VPLGGCAQNATLVTSRPRLPSRTTLLGHDPFCSQFKQLISLNRVLEECQILLCLQETDMEVREAMLAEEQVCDLHPHDRRDLSTGLEGIHARVDQIRGERPRGRATIAVGHGNLQCPSRPMDVAHPG
jgi:hypothetical protein